MSYLDDLDNMPKELRSLYQVRADFGRTLANFHTWWSVWKASVLNDVEDEQAADIAESCWRQLRGLRAKIVSMHAKLGFSEAENAAFELPREEYEQKIKPEISAPAPARMPPTIKELLEGQ